MTVHVDRRPRVPGAHRHGYDLILFALPDSLTLVSGQSSLRLESYLFTIEALRAARDHLHPDGVFAMYNYYRERGSSTGSRTRWTRSSAHAPCIDNGRTSSDAHRC